MIFPILLVLTCGLIAIDGLEPPPCDQIARNTVMCTMDRFKSRCAKECSGGGNGGGNGGGGGGGGGPSVTKTIQKQQKATDGNHNGKNTEEKPTSPANRVTPKRQEFTRKPHEITSKVTQVPMTEEHTGHTENHHHDPTTKWTKSITNKPTTQASNKKTNTKACNKLDPCIDLQTANSGFRQRCEAANIKSTCLDKCRYDITFDELKKAMLSKQCPIDGMRDYLKCGANQQDNRMCCENKGVLEGKRAFCHPFCNPNGAEWPAPNQALKYLPCSSQMSAIMKCHWAGLTA